MDTFGTYSREKMDRDGLDGWEEAEPGEAEPEVEL